MKKTIHETLDNMRLSKELQTRVYSLAYIYASEKQNRINYYMNKYSIELFCIASVVYTIGALKRLKRIGVCMNYRQAIERLESEQIGDRGCPLTRSIGMDRMTREINHYNYLNKGNKMSIDGIQYINDYDNLVNINNELITVPHWTIIDNKIKDDSQYRSIGKVYGSLYNNYIELQNYYDPQYRLTVNKEELNIRKKDIELYFSEYISHLSKTSKQNIKMIIDRDNSEDLTNYNYVKKEDKKLSASINYLFRNFPCNKDISCKEYVKLLKEYVRDIV